MMNVNISFLVGFLVQMLVFFSQSTRLLLLFMQNLVQLLGILVSEMANDPLQDLIQVLADLR